jgi:hypothetical protein
MPSSNGHRGFVAGRGLRAGPILRAARAFTIVLAAASAWAAGAAAQEPAQGFAVERFYPAAPGGGWMVMDDLDMRGGLGGGIAVSGGYARKPLRVTTSDGSQRLAVVSDQAFADVGAAVTYDRYRLYFNLDSPLSVSGEGGPVGGYFLKAPSVGLGSNPDTFSDVRAGFDARVLGGAKSSFRLGAGAQLMIPSGDRNDYVSDGTYRAMGRVLFAGNVGLLTYAGQLGVHIRPLDDSPAPGSPQGSELLFGVAAGPKLATGGNGAAVVVLGPEIYGETAFRSFLGTTATGVEGLLTARIEAARGDGTRLRVKWGTGGGINPHFGAPEWRAVFALEVFEYDMDCPSCRSRDVR